MINDLTSSPTPPHLWFLQQDTAQLITGIRLHVGIRLPAHLVPGSELEELWPNGEISTSNGLSEGAWPWGKGIYIPVRHPSCSPGIYGWNLVEGSSGRRRKHHLYPVELKVDRGTLSAQWTSFRKTDMSTSSVCLKTTVTH